MIEAQDLGAVRLANLETAFAKFEVTLSSIQAQNDLAFKAMRSRAEGVDVTVGANTALCGC